jgi:hypothetical protein
MSLRFAFTRACWRSRLAFALIAAGSAAGAAACGSRTGLFGPEPEFLSSTDAGRDADADLDGAVPCIPGRFDFELAVTQLMFVIDRSGSMKFTLDGRDEIDGAPVPRSQWRWTILRDALRQTLPSFDEQIAMGAKFFPEELTNDDLFSSERSCRTDTGVAIPPKRGNSNAIIATFDRTEPLGGTPTSEAIRIAAQALSQSRSVARTLVVATDGAPNCNRDLDARTCVCTSTVPCSTNPGRGRYSCLDDERTIATIRSVAEDQKIPVYVIGIGSTERPDFLRVLDEMAIAGGRPRSTTPRHYNVQSPDDLTNALETIRDSVAKCTFLTPSAPVDPDLIRVEIDGRPVPRDPTKTNGWDWIDQTFGWLAFFGDACRAAQRASSRASGVSGTVSCEE